MSRSPEEKQIENRIATAELVGGCTMMFTGVYLVPDAQEGFAIMVGGFYSMIRGFVRAWAESYPPPENR